MARRNRYCPPSARMRQIRADIVRPDPEPEPEAKPKPKATRHLRPKRARDEEGQYVGDDPSTPHVNEAYVGGKPTVDMKWSAQKDNKSRLLEVAEAGGLGGLSMVNTKAEIVAALEKAGL